MARTCRTLGYTQDDSYQTISIEQDDATNEVFVKASGKTLGAGRSLLSAVLAAAKEGKQ